MGTRTFDRRRSRHHGVAAAAVAAGLALAGCGGSTSEDLGTTPADPPVEAVPTGSDAPRDTADPDGVARDTADPDGAASDTAGPAGAEPSPGEVDRLAMADGDTSDGGTADAPPVGDLDVALAQIGECLDEAGADVGELTLADVMIKAQGDLPAGGGLVDIFAFFLDRDPADPAFVAAVDACRETVYAAPGLAAFLPPPD